IGTHVPHEPAAHPGVKDPHVATDQPEQPHRPTGDAAPESPWDEVPGHVRRLPGDADPVDVGPVPSDPDELAAEVKVLREEVELLRRRAAAAPGRIRMLEERLLETKGRLQAAQTQNTKLSDTLRSAR